MLLTLPTLLWDSLSVGIVVSVNINPLPHPGIRLSVRTPFLRFPARSRSGGAIFLSWSHQPSPRAT